MIHILKLSRLENSDTKFLMSALLHQSRCRKGHGEAGGAGKSWCAAQRPVVLGGVAGQEVVVMHGRGSS